MLDRKKLNIFVPLFIVALVLVLFMPKNPKFGYDYKKGRPWKYETLFAKFDFPIYKTEEQLRSERSAQSNTVIPYFRFQDDIANKSLKAVEGLDLGPVRSATISTLRSIYNRGVIADEGGRKRELAADVIYVQKNKRASKMPVAELYRQADARAKLLADISAATKVNVDSIFRAVGIYDYVVPNVIFDEMTTELVSIESDNRISLTSGYVNAGQLIVSNGEIVTGEIAQMLDSYKREFEENMGYVGSPFLIWLGDLILALAFVALLFFAVYYTNQFIFQDTRYPYLLTIVTIFSVVTCVLVRIDTEMLYWMPFTLSALMLQAFMKNKVIVPIYVISLLPLLIFAQDGPALFVMFLIAGMVHICAFRYFQRGWQQFIAALITFAVLALTYLGFRSADLLVGNTFRHLSALFVASMFTVAGYPLVYLFERIFNLVSISRLVELCDTSNPIIRELEKKAPGSFQHSLQVMNMCEYVARAVDVSPELVKAAALYHDIGKMNNPLCFVENESLANIVDEDKKYHYGLTPLQSAQDIMRHVTDGVEIAKKHRLPQIIINFISRHHGTTTVRYFYNKHVQEGGDPADIDMFRYSLGMPETKAEIILMLCDSIEAASRTLKSSTPEALSAFVEEIVSGKMEESQFDKADISISELGVVKETLKQYLAQMHHERIVYPKNKRKNK